MNLELNEVVGLEITDEVLELAAGVTSVARPTVAGAAWLPCF